jgi:hypothetical protein
MHIRFIRSHGYHSKGDEMPNYHTGAARILVERGIAEAVETASIAPAEESRPVKRKRGRPRKKRTETR